MTVEARLHDGKVYSWYYDEDNGLSESLTWQERVDMHELAVERALAIVRNIIDPVLRDKDPAVEYFITFQSKMNGTDRIADNQKGSLHNAWAPPGGQAESAY